MATNAIIPIRRAETFTGEQLCDTCHLLRLSADRFRVGSSGKQPALFVRDSLPQSRKTPSKIRLNSGLGKTSLGVISEIQERGRSGGCALCRLVSTAISRYSDKYDGSTGSGTDANSECFMVWEVDGRQALQRRGREAPRDQEGNSDKSPSFSNASRRIRFWWTQKDGKELDAYILLLSTSDQLTPSIDPRSPRNMKFLGHDFSIEKCNAALFKKYPLRFSNLIQQTWFGVIDVVSLRLCRLPFSGRPARYVALSYVWGDSATDNPHRTLRKNMARRIEPGGIDGRTLPRTIRETIQVTRDIGERYIWVDSLCIVQDSTFSWRLNADQMDLVYGNAYLTICAADGLDSSAGLHALDKDKADEPLKASYNDSLRLLVSRPSESVIGDSAWNQRAWTFQERILSRRCLVFAGGRVYFQCRSSNMSQDITPDATGQGLSMDWKNSPLRTMNELTSRPIWFYMTTVSLYTGRHLTYTKDILPAFEGVSRLIEPYIQGHADGFVFGLPPSHFDLALLWSPLSAQRRRRSENQDDQALPSWSWAGWMDVEDKRKGSPVKYLQDMLEGCFVDTREWHLKHTWIRWYIRNSEGDLRPIWDSKLTRNVEGVLHRWWGYATDAGPCSPLKLYQPWIKDNHSDTESSTSFPKLEEYPNLPPIEVQRVRSDSRWPQDHLYDQWTPQPPPRRLQKEIVVCRSDEISTETIETTTSTEIPNDRYRKDEYGRFPRGPGKQTRPVNFIRMIPDNPFGIRMVDFETRLCDRLSDRSILQFWTWRARFYVVHNEATTESSSPGDGLVRCDIADENADWCGHIVLNESYVRATEQETRKDFIALSDAKSFTKSECANWAHYIPQAFDDIEWELYFVLLIEWNEESAVWERVGLGKVLRAAFDNYGQ